jgi:hypothetical protein
MGARAGLGLGLGAGRCNCLALAPALAPAPAPASGRENPNVVTASRTTPLGLESVCVVAVPGCAEYRDPGLWGGTPLALKALDNRNL